MRAQRQASSNILLKMVNLCSRTFLITQPLKLCYAGRYASSLESKKRTVGIG